MNTKLNIMLFCAALALAGTAAAQDPAGQDEEGWSGKGELGLVRTTGNSETESLHLKLGFVREGEKWRHRAGANALRADDTGVTTAERYGLEWQSDYKLTDRSWVLGALRYESDKFSAYDNQKTYTLGYGHMLLDNATHKLVGEVGVGYRDAELLTGETETGTIFRGVVDYAWTVTDTTEFTNRFLVESGSDNTFMQNVAGLAVAINSRFAMKFAYEYRHNSDVTPGVDNTDTITSANLVYNF